MVESESESELEVISLDDETKLDESDDELDFDEDVDDGALMPLLSATTGCGGEQAKKDRSAGS